MTRSEDNSRLIVDDVFKRHGDIDPPQSALIPLLQDVQSEIGYLPKEALDRVSQLLKLPTSHVYGVATFYHQFRLRPRGRNMITICRGTACHVKGSQEISDLLRRELRMSPLDDTSEDGIFTLQQVRCVGACSLAPVIKVNEEFRGKMDVSKIRRVLSEIKAENEG